MRYYLLLAFAKAFLASGEFAQAAVAALIFFAGAPHFLFARRLGTVVSAMAIAAIAITADHDLATATNAKVETGAWDPRLLGRGEQSGKEIVLDLCEIRCDTASVV